MAILEEKIKHSKELIAKSMEKYEKIAVACSFGKDSMVTVHLSREVAPEIPVFNISTIYKPRETLEYLVEMNKKMNLNVNVYIVADKAPEILEKNNIKVIILPTDSFKEAYECEKREKGKELYETCPDLCCELLKVEPTKVAVKDLDAWICGLRNTEGRTRQDYKEIEIRGNLVKINPILTFTEEDILQYLKDHEIPLHPWYTKEFPDGRKYRSLGCEPCTKPILPCQLEREGRWQNTSKCGGECGIHTKILK